MIHDPQAMSEMSISEHTAHPLALYRNHLEFNGYRVEENGELLFCRHPRKISLLLRPVPDRGVLVSTMYTLNDSLTRMQTLEYANQLNSSFIFMKAYIDTEEDGSESSLMLETFFEGEYDRTNFSILLDNIEADIGFLYRHELTESYLQ